MLPISEKFNDFAGEVVAELKAAGMRVGADLSDDKVGAKIRLAQLDRTPYMLIIGARELESGNLSIRHRDRGDEGSLSVSEFKDRVVEEISQRSL